MAELDYYKILGVDKTSDPKQLKDAFRELAFRYHPDRNTGNPEAAEKMKQINEAYAVLSDPEKRKQYDSLRSRYGNTAHQKFRSGYSEQDIFSGSDIHHIFEEMAKSFNFRGVDEIFRDVYGQRYQSFEFKRPAFFAAGFFSSHQAAGRPGRLKKTPLLSLANKAAKLAFRKLSGMELPVGGTDILDTIQLTPDQARKGGPFAYFWKKKSKKLVIQIPKGVKEGQQIRLAGMGEPGTAGAPPGDLYLKVRYWKSWSDKLREATRRLTGQSH